ncbi:hypothetical protein ACFY36_17310 [Actinoplanes sp. NPDC000266]
MRPDAALPAKGLPAKVFRGAARPVKRRRAVRCRAGPFPGRRGLGVRCRANLVKVRAAPGSTVKARAPRVKGSTVKARAPRVKGSTVKVFRGRPFRDSRVRVRVCRPGGVPLLSAGPGVVGRSSRSGVRGGVVRPIRGPTASTG